MRIAIIGGGPAGLFFASLMKRRDPAHDVRVIERDTHYPQVQLLAEYPPPELWDRVREAARYCPNRVITVEMVPD